MVVVGFGAMSLFGAVFIESLLEAKVQREKERDLEQESIKLSLRQDIHALLTAADVDHSGKVSREELSLVVNMLQENANEPGNPTSRDFKKAIDEKKEKLGLKGHGIRAAVEMTMAAMRHLEVAELDYEKLTEKVLTTTPSVEQSNELSV